MHSFVSIAIQIKFLREVHVNVLNESDKYHRIQILNPENAAQHPTPYKDCNNYSSVLSS